MITLQSYTLVSVSNSRPTQYLLTRVHVYILNARLAFNVTAPDVPATTGRRHLFRHYVVAPPTTHDVTVALFVTDSASSAVREGASFAVVRGLFDVHKIFPTRRMFSTAS